MDIKICLALLLTVGSVLTADLSSARYLLWTRSNSGNNNYQVLELKDSSSLASSNFDGDRKTYFVYHGWTSNGLTDFILNAKTDTLDIEDANFISVDWEDLASSSTYDPSVDNVYLIAEQTADFINWLTEETSLKLSNMHIWGHSLGAHCSGMTGYYLQSYGKGSVARITGLDPAGPLFYSKDGTERIDKSQADFVDIIHTNAAVSETAGAGLYDAMGHVDFFPNGGSSQPGCSNIISGELGDFLTGCSHGRSHDYFVESIKGSAEFTSYPCDSESDFNSGSCNSCGRGCLAMGFHLDTSLTGTYYLNTNDDSPFAMGS